MVHTANTGHRASVLKQANKKHNIIGHRSKGQVKSLSQGRTNAKTHQNVKKTLLMSRNQRKNIAKQIQAQKTKNSFIKKSLLGTSTTPPHLVCIVPMSDQIDITSALRKLLNNNDIQDFKGVHHYGCPKLKKRFSIVVANPHSQRSIFDAPLAANTVMFLWKFNEEITPEKKQAVHYLKYRKMSASVHAVVEDDSLNSKKRKRAEKELMITMSSIFPSKTKLHTLENESDVLLLYRQIGFQKSIPNSLRDRRFHMLAEKCSFKPNEDAATGRLHLEGYVRGLPPSANSLIHIPGMDSFQIESITTQEDPNLFLLNKVNNNSGFVELIDKPEPHLQESLSSTKEDDPNCMEDEESEMESETEDGADDFVKPKQLRPKQVPKGTSEYQASWIPSDDEDDYDDDNLSVLSESMEPRDVDDSEDDSDLSDEEEYETMTMTDAGDNYDKQFDLDQEMNEFDKIMAAREDEIFPDEIDTPKDIMAKERFKKYRGLESFRTSPWDPKVGVPEDYNKIYQFPNFRHIRKNAMVSQGSSSIGVGSYVEIVLKDVPKHFIDDDRMNDGFMALCSLLKYEQKMTVLNLVLKSHTANHHMAIRSKEKLIFHIGFTRFANNPIFSEHTNNNKHKFCRFFHPGQTVMATMYAPVAYPPCPVTVFQTRLDGSQILVAHGSVYSVDANRIICKRVVLSGHPFKVNKRSAVIRYMFFNPHDINYFKSIELRTKWGKKGRIVEALGTHGHMKCKFNGQLKSQDTILMRLYKRVFPKWNYDPHVPLSNFIAPKEPKRSILQGSESLFDDDNAEHKSKKVRFSK